MKRLDARAAMTEIIPMTFNELCKQLRVTPEERDQLAWFLATHRAREIYKLLRKEEPCKS